MSIILRPVTLRPVTLRQIDLETDLPGLAALENEEADEPVTVETLREQEAKRPTNELNVRRIAVDADGHIIGSAEAFHRENHRAGAYWIALRVAQACRRQRIGTALYNELEASARQQGAAMLRIKIKEDKTESLRFARRHGFQVAQHQFRSILDVAAFDASRFDGIIESVQAQGIRFFSFADTDGGIGAQRRLYDLNTIVASDNPANDPGDVWLFEDFVKDVYGGDWFRPEGQIFAADGETWVGMAAVGEVRPGRMHNMMTGVRREYRGRHIALALKLLAIEFCRQHNAVSIDTGNDSTNAAMLAINRKLGYEPESGTFRLEKSLL